jgi:hypothetical protein
MRALALAVLIFSGCGPEVEPRPIVTAPMGSRLYGVFEGKTPCDDCERIKFALTLFVDETSGRSTTYVLERIYVGKGNDRTVTEGDWGRFTGIPLDADARYYALAGTEEDVGRYLAVGENLLLLLDSNYEPRVGNASHSFTLSRTQ